MPPGRSTCSQDLNRATPTCPRILRLLPDTSPRSARIPASCASGSARLSHLPKPIRCAPVPPRSPQAFSTVSGIESRRDCPNRWPPTTTCTTTSGLSAPVRPQPCAPTKVYSVALGRGDVEPVAWINYQRGAKISAPDYMTSRERLHDFTRQMVTWWNAEPGNGDGFDLLLTPTLGIVPPRVGYLVDGDERTLTRRLARVTPYLPPVQRHRSARHLIAAGNSRRHVARGLADWRATSGCTRPRRCTAARCRTDGTSRPLEPSPAHGHHLIGIESMTAVPTRSARTIGAGGNGRHRRGVGGACARPGSRRDRLGSGRRR